MTTTYWLGAHKTATTYLQKSLDLSGEVLEHHGLDYVELDEFRNRWTRPLLNRDHEADPEPTAFGDHDRDLLVFDENIPGLVQHALRDGGFYPEAEDRLATVVDHLRRPVDELVFGIRDYASYLPSLYCETLKSTPFRTFDDYLRVSFGDDGFGAMNWYQLIRRLLEAHPDARTRVYVHETLRGRESLLLEEVLGIPHEDFTMVQTSERLGFSHRAVEHLHEIDEQRTVEFADVRKAVRTWPRSDGHTAFDPWSDEQRRALSVAYARDRAFVEADDAMEVVRLAGLGGTRESRATAGDHVTASSATSIPVGRRRGIDEPDLSVVVPVHDAADTVATLVEDLLGTPDLRVQVVLVDDASTDGSDDLVDDLATSRDVVALHHERNAGAGIARNTGLGAVIGRHTLFFDADDTVHVDALARVVAELDRSGADVAMTSYHYHRFDQPGHTGMNTYDEETWAEYLQGGSVRLGELESMPRLLGFSNYPWNKVVRTDRYRDVGLRFGATPVHNDILGHWNTLLFARTILLMDDPMCTHVVGDTSRNLTNRHSEVRLRLFDALDETYDLLEANPALRNRYAHFYWSMVMRVAGWAGDRIDRDHASEFNHLLTQHLLRVNLTDYARIRTRRDPNLADAMMRRASS